MTRPLTVTTPIYYVNDKPHIGHVYTTVAADAAARFARSAGRRVRFLTGIDEHGQKVAQAAKERGLTPQEHCDAMVPRFTALWERLAISHDDFIRTTEPRHKAVVQEFLSTLHRKGDIYQATYAGWYCVPDERFWTEKDVPEGKCPDCGRPVTRIEESNWFFRMGNYQQALVRHLEENPDFIRPESRRNEMLGFLRQSLGDLCISRPKSRLSWGIELPFAPDYVTYVWFDALVNYVTGTGFASDPERFAEFWPEARHLIGKDILTPHAVYWPTMLMAMGLPLPRRIFAHGWWTMEGRKMSKSLGNVVDPNDLIDRFGADALRYFLLREVPFGLDGDFSHAALVGRINADLANDLGNLLARSLGMMERYRGGEVPFPPAPAGELEADLRARGEAALRELTLRMEEFAFNRALQAVGEFTAAANRYVDAAAPWALAKAGEQKRLDSVLYHLAEALRQIAVMMTPFMPATGARMMAQLGLSDRPALGQLTSLTPWGQIPPGTRTRKGESLFPRIEDETTEKTMDEKKDVAPTPSPSPTPPLSPSPGLPVAPSVLPEGVITIEDFAKVRLAAAVILEAERVPKSRKLVRLLVDVGERRQIVAGIGERYSPEELVGRRIAVVANLAPATLMGVASQGMLLAATDAEGIHLLTFDAPVAPGSRIK